MSGLGLFKTGKPKNSHSEPRAQYHSTISIEDFETSDAELGNDDVGDDEDGNSFSSSMSPVPQDIKKLLLPSQQVKKTMKLLKYACMGDATLAKVTEAATTVHRLANTTYAVKSDLGERGVCEALVLMLEKHKANAEVALELAKAVNGMLVSDDVNKVRLAKLGACRLTIDLMKVHNDDAAILETCCKLIVEFGNGKFAQLLEDDFRKQEERREMKSRSMKRRALTPSRIAAMSPAAAASAVKALEEADAKDRAYKERAMHAQEEVKQEQLNQKAALPLSSISEKKFEARSESKRERSDAKKFEIPEQGAVWDNRLELCKVGACEALARLLQYLVKVPHNQSMLLSRAASTLLPSIFEDEDVVVAACGAIASLAAEPSCAKLFAKDGQISRSLSTLLLHMDRWPLVTASMWAMINLCADSRSGNRERLGPYAIEHLCKLLTDLTARHEELAHIEGFHRLVEYTVWALLNMLIATPANQTRVRALDKEELVEELSNCAWAKAGVKDKLRQIVKALDS